MRQTRTAAKDSSFVLISRSGHFLANQCLASSCCSSVNLLEPDAAGSEDYMAGSHRSPVLKDQWRGSSGEVGDQRGREKHSRPRGSHRDRGRERFRDQDRHHHHPPNDDRLHRSSRSPPPRSFPGPDNKPQHRDFSTNIASTRASPAPSRSEIRPSQNINRPDSPERIGYRVTNSHMRSAERNHRREDSPSAPPFKRQRTHSPPPDGFQGRPPTHSRGAPPRHGRDFDREPSHSKGRGGRPPGRGRPSRRPSPRRERERRKHDSGLRDPSRNRQPWSHDWEDKPPIHPSRRYRSPPLDGIERDSYLRSPSRVSAGTLDSRTSALSRRGSKGDIAMHPPPSPSRLSLDRVPDTGYGAGLPERSRASRSPVNSYHESTRPSSPYSTARSGRSGQHSSHPSQHSFRASNFSEHDSPSRLSHGQPTSSHHVAPSHSYRDGQQRYQETHQDRRISGIVPTAPLSHARNRFSSPQRDASASRSRAGPPSPPQGPAADDPPPPPPPPTEPRSHREGYQNLTNHRPASRETRAPDEGSGHDSGSGFRAGQTGQPDTRPPEPPSGPSKGGKISFAFKAKTGPPSAPKPVPDLAQRMLAREPPQRVAEPPRSKMSSGPPPRFKPEPRFDRRDRDRDRHRDRDRNRGRNDRRDYREPRGSREARDYRDSRRDDRRVDPRDKRRNDKASGVRPERRHDPSPEPVKRSKIMLRLKPRPTISEEFANSDSVYFRKPGNESVIGAGTYGKVFKAIHVYTQRKVALKKIRMEGEKDGFPVTAVREIKLLQHLRNHNVVSLLEVMVEKNECFMVFEYLSHDLTGLINHPTFTLTAAHKKDLAKQMFEGLSYLHHRGVLHRDIKAANILISNQGRLKYADFGLARFFSKSRQLDYTNRVITIWYRPPELLLGETQYGPAVDVWSAACVYVEMFTKKAVFPGEGGEISQLDKLYNTLGTPTRAEWPNIVEMPWFELMRPTERRKRIFEDIYRDILSPAALDMVSQVFRYDPAKRPSAEDVLAHPYFHSEEPSPQQPIELENIQGDWHEFESKALRKERDREARRAEYQRDKEKRKILAAQDERETKRIKPDTSDGLTSSVPQPGQQ
ncbi:protein stk47 [Aspergillus nidulans FGSC A4]|uniref:cyclin-dependent kinase n=1 Tax=Emericella nidulans (strain FGSC A4 / ATCC 38163 / CBS 112.46 / NRRL 194 / M139) TaxID=227321 RepID=C8V751_EMENI|nr:protein stk47 [Aspergillus nidulans FGSC A4]CBF74071.1 TPA: protein kinase, putative (AFU_orthologue; AFUA_5G03160) [Aspergillus nidulans FGSC A4]